MPRLPNTASWQVFFYSIEVYENMEQARRKSHYGRKNLNFLYKMISKDMK